MKGAHQEVARLNQELAVLASTMDARNQDNYELSETVRRAHEAKVTADRELSNVRGVATVNS